MPAPKILRDRYELGEVLGRGGMGVVYKAYDTRMKRDVALKTILDVDNQTALDLFYKEWGVQASIVHPNIVGIYDIGEFDDNGVSKPFFVMPLLPGVTLEHLIREGSTRLDSDTVIQMICQACRGLQAAHEHGLVHRDMKPSNIFVIDDDSVKLIDFGVVHVVGAGSRTNMKGTLAYMAPEQVKFKSPTVLSDEFSLAVVCYEALTRRRPFRGASDEEISDAILNHIPAPVSDLNADVPHQVSQVIHKALAKNPWHRFPTVREFGESLQKAVRQQPIEFFDDSKVKPRIQKAQVAFEQGDHAFANEVLSELEGEGHLDAEITMLRGKLNQAMKQTRIQALLEGARRFVSASEYSLALRKVQEALEIDPRDPDVLALQLHIEKNRHQTQIQEWFRLCQQHIENRSFQQARDAVGNVLKTRPNDTQALELMAEIDRRENELVQTRREEYDLYEAARESWERGEVTSALSKLEHLIAIERHRPRTDSGRGATYQKFYNQVRSERDAIKNAYERARADMENGNFEAALAVCQQFLAKYPTHALFHSLKFDVEERSRQKLSSYIAEIDQKVEAEPDLDRRLAILDEAIERYPGEKHFERARALVRDKRELVDAIVAKARYYEEHEQFAEALDQWQTLARIHNGYQGIDFELERLEKRRRRQAEQTARSRWIDQIERCLESGDYNEAVAACAKSLEEFPEDPELTELERLSRKNAARRKEAMDLVTEARGLLENGKPAEGLEVVQRARQLDERSPVVRAILLNTLFECARADAKSSPEKAQEHLDQILEIDPLHSMALSLRAELHSERQDEHVGAILAQARRLQAEDDARGALAAVEEGLRQYPDDTRLGQLRVTLNRSSEEVRSRRYRDLQEAIHLDEMAVGATDPSKARVLLNRAHELVGRHASDTDFRNLEEKLKHDEHVVVGGAAPKRAASSGSEDGSNGAHPSIHDPAAEVAGIEPFDSAAPVAKPAQTEETNGAAVAGNSSAAGIADPPETPALLDAVAVNGSHSPNPPVGVENLDAAPHEISPGESSGAEDEPRTPPDELSNRAKPAAVAFVRPLWTRIFRLLSLTDADDESAHNPDPLRLALAAVILLAVLELAFVIWRTARPEDLAPLDGVKYGLSVKASPAGAAISVDGEQCGLSFCELLLTPGEHRVEASLAGYRSSLSTVDLGAGKPDEPEVIQLALDPLAPTLRVSSDLAAATIELDGKAIGQLDDGEFEFELAGAGAGDHTISIRAAGAFAVVPFTISPGSAPELRAGIRTQTVVAAAVASLGDTAEAVSSESLVAATLDGSTAGSRGPGGMRFLGVAAGSHDLTLETGNQSQFVTFETGPAPLLTIHVGADRNVGSLQITANEDDARVYLNGNLYRRATQNGGRLLVYLVPNTYSVRLEKDGFRPTEVQVAEVRRGARSFVEFDLKPIPTAAGVRIENGIPGTEVLIDGTSRGSVRPNGVFSIATLEPGRHEIELRKSNYRARQLAMNFVAGDPLIVDGALENAIGGLELQIEPPEAKARVTLRREGDSREEVLNELTLNLPEATYTLSAKAPGYRDASDVVHIGPDRTVRTTLRLEKLAPPPPKPPAPLAEIGIWEKAVGWERDGDLLVRNGGGLSLASIRPERPGTYSFTVILRKGKRLEWIVNYVDDLNYLLFQIDKSDFYRNEIVDGKRTTTARVQHGLDHNEFINVQILVTPNKIEHRIQQGGPWRTIDTYEQPGREFTRGRFGFRIPGRDEVGLGHFDFTPQ